MEVENRLAELRQKRGLGAAALAKMAGVSRQTIYAMEAGSYVPNTAVALRMARALETTVEELFSLAGDAPGVEARSESAVILPGSGEVETGQPVQLCQVNKHLMAVPPSPVAWYLPVSDAILTAPSKVRIYDAGADFGDRVLVAGCDPGISVLARHVQPGGVELVLAHRNSSQSLELLRQGSIHIAGTHLRDEPSGESNLPEIGRLFPKNTVAVICFAVWEEGLVTAPGNPKEIRGVEDLARQDVAIVNREEGAGSRNLLDTRLRRAGIDASGVRGYGRTASGHLAAAWQVQTGGVDCCVATRAAARVFGLGFVPLATERYDLAIRRQHLELPGVRALLDTLNRASFRRELEGIGGYDTRSAGRRVL